MIQPWRCVTLGKVTKRGITKYRLFHYTLNKEKGEYIYTGMNEFATEQSRQNFINYSKYDVVDKSVVM